MILSELSVTSAETAGKISYILKNSINSLEWEADNLRQITSIKDKHNRIDAFHKAFTKINNNLLNVWLINKNGIMKHIVPTSISRNDPSIIGKDYSTYQYFKTAKGSKKTTISNIINVEGDNTNKKTLAIAVPLLNKKGEFEGILGADLNIHQLIADIKINKTDKLETKTTKEVMEMFCLSTDDGIIISGADLDNIGKEITTIPSQKILNFIKPLSSIYKNTAAGVFVGKKGKFLTAASLITLKGNHTPYAVLITIPQSVASKQLFSLYIKQLVLMVFIFITVILVMYTLIANKKVISKQVEKIKQLEIQLNEEAKHKSVSEIEETEYFKSLIKRAKTLKKQ